MWAIYKGSVERAVAPDEAHAGSIRWWVCTWVKRLFGGIHHVEEATERQAPATEKWMDDVIRMRETATTESELGRLHGWTRSDTARMTRFRVGLGFDIKSIPVIYRFRTRTDLNKPQNSRLGFGFDTSPWDMYYLL